MKAEPERLWTIVEIRKAIGYQRGQLRAAFVSLQLDGHVEPGPGIGRNQLMKTYCIRAAA